MLSENFVFVSVLLNTLGVTGYFVATLRGRSKPNRVTWLLWALAPLIGFFAQLGEGVGIQALLTFAVGFGPLMVFAASFANRETAWRFTRLDVICGSLSIVGLVLWAITREGLIAIALTIAADGLAALPTFIKAARFPDTEHPWAFWMGATGALLTVMTLDSWSFDTSGFPIYLVLMNTSLAGVITFGSAASRASSA